MSHVFGLVFLVITGGSAAIGVGRKVLERRRARRTLREKQPLEATSPEGTPVRVSGIVRVLDDTLIAPLSGRTCVVYRARARNNKGWTGRAARPNEVMAMVPFLLDRGGGRLVTVEGHDAVLDLPPIALERPRGASSPQRVRQDQLVLALGLPTRGRPTFEEVLVEPGMNIMVAGLLMRDLATEASETELGFREAPPTTIRLAGNVEHPLAIGPADPAALDSTG